MKPVFNSYYFRCPPEAHADATMFTKTGMAYTPKQKKEYQKRLLESFWQASGDLPHPFDGPVIAIWSFLILKPKAKKKINVKDTKPDTDGYLKVVKDVIQEGPLSKKAKKPLYGLGLLTNDSQIFCELTQKVYVDKEIHQATSLILCPLNPMLTKTSHWRCRPHLLLEAVMSICLSNP